MSHTDKTAPFWVQVKRDSKVIRHDHRRGFCDFDQYDEREPNNTWCGYEIDWSKIYWGRPRFAHEVETMLQRQQRRKWKNAIATQDPDDINIGRYDSAWLID